MDKVYVYKDSLTICFSNYSKRVIWVPAPAPALPTSKRDGFHASLLARLLACVNYLLRFYLSFNRVRPRMHPWSIGRRKAEVKKCLVKVRFCGR